MNDHLTRLALGATVCLGRSTITGLLHASGESFQDWSAGYRLFSQQRVEPQRLLDASRREVLARLPPEAPLLVAIDDTLLAKSSLKTPGVSWRRAPLGPKFQANLILAQRFLQFSAALPPSERQQPAGGKRDVRLVVIRPLGYRPRAGSKVLYRKPPYLIVSDPNLSLEQIVRQYVWRWEIEVNCREQKTLLGVGQAQVRQPDAVERIPQFMTAVYALLVLPGASWSRQQGVDDALPRPHWRRRSQPQRLTTQRLISHLRAELWADGVQRQHFCGLRNTPHPNTKLQKLPRGAPPAAIYASG